jgi:hypothetical protein
MSMFSAYKGYNIKLWGKFLTIENDGVLSFKEWKYENDLFEMRDKRQITNLLSRLINSGDLSSEATIHEFEDE